jgi:hypothetical protein
MCDGDIEKQLALLRVLEAKMDEAAQKYEEKFSSEDAKKLLAEFLEELRAEVRALRCVLNLAASSRPQLPLMVEQPLSLAPLM